jgi:hypothetical protein
MAGFGFGARALNGGWIWEPLAGQSTAAGHVVEAPDLRIGNSTHIFGPRNGVISVSSSRN